MDGFIAIVVVLVIYFIPSIAAEMRGHTKSGGVFALNLFLGWTFFGWVIALVWAVSGDQIERNTKPSRIEPIDDPEPKKDDELIEAARNIERIIAACQKASPEAFAILVTAANADGKVSRADLTIIANFCTKQGAEISQEWLKSISRLNTGINLAVSGDPTRMNELAAIKGKPIVFLATLHGALTALTISNKRTASVAANLISKVEYMLQSPGEQPEQPKYEVLEIDLSGPDFEAKEPLPSTPEIVPDQPKPKPFSPQGWVEKARAELAAERKR